MIHPIWLIDRLFARLLRYLHRAVFFRVFFLGIPLMSNATLKEEDRKAHTYITGSTKSGKSELIKILAYHYIAKKRDYCTTIIVDPHGDLSEEIARFKEHSTGENLVYVHPFLRRGHTPIINPFQINSTDEYVIDRTAQELSNVFQELIKDSTLTLQMETLLVPCISTIIRNKGNLLDLQVFMDDEKNNQWVNLGKESPQPAHREFFRSAFARTAYHSTKQSIYTKIQSLLNSHAFYNLVVGDSTVDMESIMNSKKTVIFNLAKGELGSDPSEAFGRFVIAVFQSFALQRSRMPKHKRIPVHLHVDECQNYLSPSIGVILTESRKFGLHLTMAQQFWGQGMNTDLRDVVISNTEVKFCGKNASKTLKAFSMETGVAFEDLQQNPGRGVFFLRSGSSQPTKIQLPSFLVGHKHSMSRETWKTVIDYQVETYYQKTGTATVKARKNPDLTEDRAWKPKFGLPT